MPIYQDQRGIVAYAIAPSHRFVTIQQHGRREQQAREVVGDDLRALPWRVNIDDMQVWASQRDVVRRLQFAQAMHTQRVKEDEQRGAILAWGEGVGCGGKLRALCDG